jgi:hypothetical protein
MVPHTVFPGWEFPYIVFRGGQNDDFRPLTYTLKGVNHEIVAEA